jgi:hypothetical protein
MSTINLNKSSLQFHETLFGVDTGQSEVQLDISGRVNITRGQHLLTYVVLGKTVQLIAYDLLSVFFANAMR